MKEQLARDIQAYKSASTAYVEMCALGEASRKVANKTRDSRRALFTTKVEAAENMLMTIQNHFGESLKKMGIYSLYTECTSGDTGAIAILFRIADETMKLEAA